MERELKNTDFKSVTEASKLDLSNIKYNSTLHKLIDNLNVNLGGYGEDTGYGIMMFGVVCNHDSYHMCKHRLQWIVDFLKDKIE
jgi:hypothetical protein